MNKIEIGLSAYFSYGEERINKLLDNAHKYNFDYIFSSLQIPEEDVDYVYVVKSFMSCCNKYKLKPIIDVSPTTINKLGLKSIYDLKDLGVECIRLDFGFDYDQIVEMSKVFRIVFNASTFDDIQYLELKKRNADFSNMFACHNYYPKVLTGLSKNYVKEINKRIHSYGMKTIGFIMGDDDLRGPLHNGLPTVEDMRNKDVLYNTLVMYSDLECDVVIVGDFGLKVESLIKLNELKNGYISIPCELVNDYEYLCDYIHHDRKDRSEYFFRSVESRSKCKSNNPQYNCVDRKIGDLCISNDLFLRYSGELEIMKKHVVKDDRVNVVGHVDNEYIKYINYTNELIGVKIKKR